MFLRYGQKGKPADKQALKDLIRVLPSQVLLEEEKRAVILEKIRGLSSLAPARFETLVVGLLHPLINHCQLLPDGSTLYYSEPGGLLDSALHRTESALQLFRHCILPSESGQFSEIQQLWEYALVSAALLKGLGMLYVDYSIENFDAKGAYLTPWDPLITALAASGPYYRYTFEKEANHEFRKRLNGLIARFLMPDTGFAWIAGNPAVLEVWLALLHEDYAAAGALGALLIRANGLNRRHALSKRRPQAGTGGSRRGRISTFTDTVPDTVSQRENQVGIEFINWLVHALGAGNLVVNKAFVFLIPAGLVLLPEIFQLFMRENPSYKQWQMVRKGLLSLGLHWVGKDGSVDYRTPSGTGKAMHQGIVLTDYAHVLPDELQVDKVGTLSAVAFIEQALTGSSLTATGQATLSAQGVWQSQAYPEILLPEHKTRG